MGVLGITEDAGVACGAVVINVTAQWLGTVLSQWRARNDEHLGERAQSLVPSSHWQHVEIAAPGGPVLFSIIPIYPLCNITLSKA